jgi:hypothetical protein
MRSKEEIYNKLREFRDTYDEYGYHDLHDQVYYQISGMNEDWDEMDEDLQRKLSNLVDEIESHIYFITNEPDVNWIYG